MTSNRRKYPLRRVIQAGGLSGEYMGIEMSNLALLECGHKVPPARDMYGYTCPVRQRCRLCYEAKQENL